MKRSKRAGALPLNSTVMRKAGIMSGFLLILMNAAPTQALAQAPGSQGLGTFAAGCTNPFSLTLAIGAESLDDLIANSTYIVEVAVVSAFPAYKVAGGLVVTDFVLAPQRVLKGQLVADRFVVDQPGGDLDGRSYCSSAFPGGRMSPGQRYVLFLNDPLGQDGNLPQREGLQRFMTIFGYQGFVFVEQGKVQLSRSGPSWRDGYQGMLAAQFMDEVAARAKANIPGRYLEFMKSRQQQAGNTPQ